MKARRSGSMTSAWVVHILCGARVHLQRAVLQQLDRPFGRVSDRYDLIVIAVHYQGGDLDRREILGESVSEKALMPS